MGDAALFIALFVILMVGFFTLDLTMEWIQERFRGKNDDVASDTPIFHTMMKEQDGKARKIRKSSRKGAQ